MLILGTIAAKAFQKRAKARVFEAFYQDESGQAITEYVLLLSMTLTGAVLMARGLISVINTSTLLLGGQLEKDLKTGRADLGLWSN
jgi:Flp pilus assembly pilin Flp